MNCVWKQWEHEQEERVLRGLAQGIMASSQCDYNVIPVSW